MLPHSARRPHSAHSQPLPLRHPPLHAGTSAPSSRPGPAPAHACLLRVSSVTVLSLGGPQHALDEPVASFTLTARTLPPHPGSSGLSLRCSRGHPPATSWASPLGFPPGIGWTRKTDSSGTKEAFSGSGCPGRVSRAQLHPRVCDPHEALRCCLAKFNTVPLGASGPPASLGRGFVLKQTRAPQGLSPRLGVPGAQSPLVHHSHSISLPQRVVGGQTPALPVLAAGLLLTLWLRQ